ncbi:MAG: RNA polymerase sigma-70 factor [Flammeovirgaceae bacterium]
MDAKKYDKLEEAKLIEEVQLGNREAWEYITKNYYPQILHFIASMVHDRETAEELVQDVFVNFWMKRDRFVITISLKAYLYRAARNHTLNYLKRRKFEQEYQKGLAQSMILHKNETEDEFQFSELEKALAEAIDSLPENCKEIFLMSRFEDMTYKEISQTLDIPVRTVHYQIGLALKFLREKLKGHAEQHFLMGWLMPMLMCHLAWSEILNISPTIS